MRELLAVLKEAGVVHYQQGDLKVSFGPTLPPVRASVDDANARGLAIINDLAKQAAAARDA